MAATVYSYTRFSSPRQAQGTSAERQTEMAQAWAKARGLTLDASLSMHDGGLSAYHQRHVKTGALGAFLEAISLGKIEPGSYLIVEQLDRLSRAMALQAQTQLSQIIQAGIIVVTTKDQKEYSLDSLKKNPMDLIMSLLIMIRAHEESESKSGRVKASVKNACEKWIAGTQKKIIRVGHDPFWIRQVGDKFELIPEKVQAVRLILDMYKAGHAHRGIRDKLQTLGIDPCSGQGFRVKTLSLITRTQTLIGTHHIKTTDETGEKEYALEGYYPAILSKQEWQELVECVDERSRRPAPSNSFVNIVTGGGIMKCGYCKQAMVAQNRMARKDSTGRIQDFARRILCISRHTTKCAYPQTKSVVPFERAIINYCSDLMNLRALYGTDRTQGPLAVISAKKSELIGIEKKLEKIADAMFDTDELPAIIVRKAKSLEAEKAVIENDIKAAEKQLLSNARTALDDSADKKWQALAHGVEMHDPESRMKARQLIRDTFDSIEFFGEGICPAENQTGQMDVVLLAKGGVARLLSIDKTGAVLSSEDFSA